MDQIKRKKKETKLNIGRFGFFLLIKGKTKKKKKKKNSYQLKDKKVFDFKTGLIGGKNKELATNEVYELKIYYSVVRMLTWLAYR